MNYIPGGKWTIHANGFQGDLDIRFDGGSSLSGSAFGDPISGMWQDGQVKISFTRRHGTVDQIYQGYLASPARGGPVNAVYTLAGTFDDVSGSYGWFAQQSVVP